MPVHISLLYFRTCDCAIPTTFW